MKNIDFYWVLILLVVCIIAYFYTKQKEQFKTAKTKLVDLYNRQIQFIKLKEELEQKANRKFIIWKIGYLIVLPLSALICIAILNWDFLNNFLSILAIVAGLLTFSFPDFFKSILEKKKQAIKNSVFEKGYCFADENRLEYQIKQQEEEVLRLEKIVLI